MQKLNHRYPIEYAMALYSAARNGHLEVVKAILKKEPGVVKWMNMKGQTTLHVAVKGQSLKVVEELIKADPSSINMVDNEGNTALHIATRKGRYQIVKLLLRHEETDTEVVNSSGESALDIAEINGNSDVKAILLEHNSFLLTDRQSSLAEADIPIARKVAVLPLADAPDSTTHVKVETLPTEVIDDELSSFETLNVSTVSQLKLLSPKLHSLRIEGCEFLEVLEDNLLGRIPTLKELYLISCSSLRSVSYPASLTTLYIRKCRELEFSPSLESRDKLPSLHHLFIGSSCDSLTTLPLDLFSELKNLCVWDCQKLVSFDLTREQIRGVLASLESLEISDCPKLKYFTDEGLHTPNLESIFISNCESLNKLPNFVDSLESLRSLFLHRCPKIESFPFGRLTSSIYTLSIVQCDKLTPQEDWGLYKFESLHRFELEGGCMDMESFPAEKLLPSSIMYLRISKLHSLKELDHKGTQHLNALHALEINCCDKLQSLPSLSSSLKHLYVQECPLLTPRLKPETGNDWDKVAHIPHLQIDDHVLSWN